MSLIKNISDKDVADAICDSIKVGKIIYLKRLQKKMANEMFYHARRLASRTSNINTGYVEGWTHDKLRKSIFVSDEVAECYLWIVEYIRKLCCKYKEEALLRTYLNNSLSMHWTKAKWLAYYYQRFTRHGIVRTRTTSYIPSCIKELSKRHQNVFVLLRRFKNEEEISQRLNIELEDINEMVDEIKKS